MKKSRLFILISIFSLVCIFVIAASCNLCGIPISIGSTSDTFNETSGTTESIGGETEQEYSETEQTSLTEKESTSEKTSGNKGENKDPIIENITIPQKPDSNPLTNELYNLYVAASDSNGDPLTYSWSATAGKISGTSNLVYWETPSQAGSYTIQVKVTDGKGGEATKSRTFDVLPSNINFTVPKIVAEGGHIEAGGNINAGDGLYAGDSLANKPCMGFISFDITSLAGANILSANAVFSLSDKHGDPSFYDSLVLNDYYWGDRIIQQSDATAPGIVIQTFTLSEPTFSCNNAALKNAFQNAVNAKRPRFQLKIWFAGIISDGDNQLDGWVYQQSDVNLSITYAPGS